jgi:long-chain acyl-CoA synthetase
MSRDHSEPFLDTTADGEEAPKTMSDNLAHNLVQSAHSHPERPAIISGDEIITYARLDALSAGIAAWLNQRGFQPGDRVGVMLPNVAEFAIAYYGVLRAGGTVVPMNILLKRREVAFYLGDPGAKLLLAWHECAADAEPGASAAGADCVLIAPGALHHLAGGSDVTRDVTPRGANDTAVILYTSGTTGRPKGAELTHANLRRNVDVTVRTLLRTTPDDVVLGALPLFHSFGQTCGLNTAVASAAALALVPRFAPDAVLWTIAQHRVTVFEGVPTMYSALLAYDRRDQHDTSTLRCCVSGGAALPAEVLRGFEEAFGCIVLEGYGLSETSPVACFNHPDAERLPGSIGTPIEGVEMRVVDGDRSELAPGEPGEIAIRGHNVMKGYLNRPEATAEAIDADGWFYTGDIGRVDAAGRYFIVDRKKDLIIRGGYNVYPREIEEVLYEHPAVQETAVIGIPHPELGEEVGAAVVLAPGSEKISETEVREYMKANVAAYKYPRHVWFVDALPKGPTGKILKREIEPPATVAQPADSGGAS